MFVHAQSYEDLTGEVEVPLPRSPGPDGTVEVTSMEQISEDFSKLSTQLSASSVQSLDQSPEEAGDQGKEDSDPASSPEGDGGSRVLDDWYRHQKHIFVLSEAGKPVYSRYRSEEALSSTAGVMMALVSFLESDKNAIRSIHAGTTWRGVMLCVLCVPVGDGRVYVGEGRV